MALEVDSASNGNEYQGYVLGDKGGRFLELPTLPSACADCLQFWKPPPPGVLRVCPALYRDCFTFTYTQTYRQPMHADSWVHLLIKQAIELS